MDDKAADENVRAAALSCPPADAAGLSPAYAGKQTQPVSNRGEGRLSDPAQAPMTPHMAQSPAKCKPSCCIAALQAIPASRSSIGDHPPESPCEECKSLACHRFRTRHSTDIRGRRHENAA
jgi:hypothetical protein